MTSDISSIVQEVMYDLLALVESKLHFDNEPEHEVEPRIEVERCSPRKKRQAFSRIRRVVDSLTYNSATVPESFQCMECFVSFPTHEQHISHTTVYHDVEQGEGQAIVYQCRICKKKDIVSVDALLSHGDCGVDTQRRRLGIDDNCLCILCATAVSRHQLPSHYRLFHADHATLQTKRKRKGNDVVYHCQWCNVPLSTYEDRLIHLSSWHPSAVTMQLLTEEPVTSCAICRASVIESALREHVRAVHLESAAENGRHETEESGETAGSSGSGRRVFSGTQDTATLPVQKARKSIRPSDSKRVNPELAPERRYQCDECNLTFESRCMIAYHVVWRICSRSVPLSCTVCGKKVDSNTLYQHVKQRHAHMFGLSDLDPMSVYGGLEPGEPGTKDAAGEVSVPLCRCDECGRTFVNPAVRCLHMRLLHSPSQMKEGEEEEEQEEMSSDSSIDCSPELKEEEERERETIPDLPQKRRQRKSIVHRCPFCGVAFKSEFTLNTHTEVFHRNRQDGATSAIELALISSNRNALKPSGAKWQPPSMADLRGFQMSSDGLPSTRDRFLLQARQKEIRAYMTRYGASEYGKNACKAPPTTRRANNNNNTQPTASPPKGYRQQMDRNGTRRVANLMTTATYAAMGRSPPRIPGVNGGICKEEASSPASTLDTPPAISKEQTPSLSSPPPLEKRPSPVTRTIPIPMSTTRPPLSRPPTTTRPPFAPPTRVAMSGGNFVLVPGGLDGPRKPYRIQMETPRLPVQSLRNDHGYQGETRAGNVVMMRNGRIMPRYRYRMPAPQASTPQLPLRQTAEHDYPVVATSSNRVTLGTGYRLASLLATTAGHPSALRHTRSGMPFVQPVPLRIRAPNPANSPHHRPPVMTVPKQTTTIIRVTTPATSQTPATNVSPLAQAYCYSSDDDDDIVVVGCVNRLPPKE